MYIGLDIGTTGCKAVVFDENGAQIDSSYREYQRSSEYQHDASVVAAGIKEVITNVCKNGVGEKIRAVSTTSCGEAFIAVDENDKPLLPVLLFSDTRGNDELNEFVSKAGADYISSVCGINPHVMFSATKIAYLRNQMPELMAKVKYILAYGEYATYVLSGERAIDAALASRTMLFDINKKQWDKKLLDILGLDEKTFGRPVESGTIIGKVLPGVAEEMGMSKDALIVCGAHDQIATAIGAGVTEKDTAVLGMGTVECITPIFTSDKLTPALAADNYCAVPFPLDGYYATYAFQFCGGAMLKWYRDTFKPERSADGGIFRELDTNAPQKPTDIFLIPHLAGSATPDMNTKVRASIVGMNLETGDRDIYRAALEGVPSESMNNLEHLKTHGISPTLLRAAGGGSRSDIWLQIKADVFGIPVIAMKASEAGAAGCCAFCAAALGDAKDVREAASRFVAIRKEFLPNPENHAIYKEKFARYMELRKLMTGFFG